MSDVHLEILVEDRSSEEFLRGILSNIRQDMSYSIHSFQGYNDLIASLPGRFRGYRHWLTEGQYVLVLLDRDDNDCIEVKQRIEKMASEAGLQTKPMGPPFQVLIRIMIEELEAWYFGDIPALTKAYPKVPTTLGAKKGYRNPDAIRGGTWEALERELQSAGYYSGIRIPKIEIARTIAPYIDVDNSTSRSFQVFRDGIRQLP